MLAESDISQICIFEMKILKRIYFPVPENGKWESRYIRDLNQTYGSPDVIPEIKVTLDN